MGYSSEVSNSLVKTFDGYVYVYDGVIMYTPDLLTVATPLSHKIPTLNLSDLTKPLTVEFTKEVDIHGNLVVSKCIIGVVTDDNKFHRITWHNPNFISEVSCDANQHEDPNNAGSCINNEKQESCDTNNNNPSNSTDIIADVTITWNSTTQSWPPAPACDWDCNNDYHKNLNQCDPNEITTQCVDNIQNTPCEVNTLIDVTSLWDSQSNQYVTP